MTEENNMGVGAEKPQTPNTKSSENKDDSSISEKNNSSSDEVTLDFKLNLTGEQKNLIKYIIIFLILMFIMYQLHQRDIQNCITFYEDMLRNQSKLWCIDMVRIIS